MVSGHPRWSQGADAADSASGRGFTVIEFVIVIAIMVIVLAIALPSGLAMRRQSRRATCASNLKAIGQALLLFREDYQCYPPDRAEYLWTKEAHDRYVNKYGVEPPNYDPISPVAAAYAPDGTPFPTYVTDPDTGEQIPLHGLGLYTLYYVGAYSAALPDAKWDPRFSPDNLVAAGVVDTVGKAKGIKGFNDPAIEWYRGAGYITEAKTFHCPENTDTDLDKYAFTDWRRLPLLSTMKEVSVWNEMAQDWETAEEPIPWNNYDLFYFRNQWNPGYKPTVALDPAQGERHLLQPYPPVDTVVTWCPYHRRDTRKAVRVQPGQHGQPPQPGHPGHPGQPGHTGPRQIGPAEQLRDFNKVSPGDQDLVLFADGSVRRLTSRADNRMFEAPAGDTGWPQGPVM